MGSAPIQILPVHPALDFTAVDGANLGDALTIAEDLIAGDTYQLAPGSERSGLALSYDSGSFVISAGTEAGHEGAGVLFDACVTFMSPDGTVVEALLLVELNADGCTLGALHVCPLAEMNVRTDYALVAIDREAGATRFAESTCVSFTAGTHITMQDGTQRPVEELRVGDRILTRENGVQPVRWIGQRTHRAIGAFAPIRIREGALNNSRDLVVSPNHRLFVYQRQDRLGTGRAEVLVKARHLVNETTVTRTTGGFVDYYQMLFDRHEIVYAEGIAVETFLLDDATRSALPAGTPEQFEGTARSAIEIDERRLGEGNAADLLKQASVG